MKRFKEVSKCPISNSEEKLVYLDLGEMPLVNNLNSTKEESLNCEKFPLAVQIFKESGLSTLTVEVDPTVLYSNYLYKSGVSKPYIDHCVEMFKFVDTYLNLDKNDLVLDIGGNDGTLLKAFKSVKPTLNVLNVDASENLTKEANENGIPSINGFWGEELALSLNKNFKLITTTNCFQHTAPIDSFVKGVSLSLTPRGIWLLEFPYWKKSIETDQFDQVYHEHIYYYFVAPLVKLLDKYGLQIIKVTPYSIHGGTLRLLISRKGENTFDEWVPCSSVEEFLKSENPFDFDNYIKWGEQIKKKIDKDKNLITVLKNSGYKIAGFGAAAKGCIYLNAANINYEQIDYIVDDTNIKQGKFIPGTGIEVVSREKLKTDPVDYIVILAHNFSDYIIRSLKQDGYKGKFILFLPELKIL